MKFYYILCVITIISAQSILGSSENQCNNVAKVDTIQVSVGTPGEYAKMNVGLLLLKDESAQTIDEIGEVLKHDLSFTKQISLVTNSLTGPIARSKIKEYAEQTMPLVIVLKEESALLYWWLYETQSGSLIAEKSCAKKGVLVRGWAHAIADQLWQAIMAKPGFFSTKIAYCKDLGKTRRVKHICVADYDGSYEETIVKTPTVNVAPRWNQSVRNPLLFYSEYTNNNMRLIAVNMKKKRKVASNFDGLNMLPSFSSDGSQVVYCASRGDGNSQLYLYKKGELKRLTHNTGNNVSPTFMANGNQFFFCSDFQTGYPQIYHFDITTQELQCITQGGYCAAPSYCSAINKLIYSKMIGSVMQLMLYDVDQKIHTQLTFDAHNKQEASWSPCGNYVLCSMSKGSVSRLAFFNLTTGNYHYITEGQTNCRYPHWSPVYATFPVVG
jgi:TolB protein